MSFICFDFVESNYSEFLFSAPGGAPRDVTAEALNTSAIRVRWRPLAVHLSNGNVRGYQVAYVVRDLPGAKTVFVNAYDGELGNLPRDQILVSSKRLKIDSKIFCFFLRKLK